MARYSTETRATKCVKRYGFLLFARNLSNKSRKKFLNTASITGVDAAKTSTKK